MAAALPGSKAGDGVSMDQEQLDLAVATVNDAGFTSAQTAMLKTLAQNFVFTTEQAAALVGCFSMSDDKMAALRELEGHLTNPAEGDVIVDLFSFSSDKETAAEVLGGFSPATVGTLAPFVIEDDGHRSPEDMEALVGALQAASMSDDKVAALKAHVESNPNPPLDVDQLLEVLACFSFSSDAVSVLEAFLGPQLVYPMPCADVVRVLETFGMSSDRMEVLPALKPFIADPQNKLAIVASFSFSSDKEAAEVVLRDVVVKLTPPEPPMAEIQAALAKVGSCPSGYAWRQVSGGWRCAAGGHYVSDATLAEAM